MTGVSKRAAGRTTPVTGGGAPPAAPTFPSAEELFCEQAIERLRLSKGLAEAVRRLREREALIQLRAGAMTQADVCRACLDPAVVELKGAGLAVPAEVHGDPAGFFEAVRRLPLSPATAPTRSHAREVSRTVTLLCDGELHVPASVCEFQALWEQAMRGEPRWSETFPSSALRTGVVTVRESLLDGATAHVCMDAAEVPPWLGRLATMLADETLPREVRAAAGLCLHDWIHPFSDGNGHTGRLLQVAVLDGRYSWPTLACLSRELTSNRQETIRLFGLLRNRQADAEGFCLGMLGQLGDAQALAMHVLGLTG